MKRRFLVASLVVLIAVMIFASASASISVNDLGEIRLYELYAEVESQMLLNQLENAEKYETVRNYDDLERNPDSHKGEFLNFKGKIIQVVEGSRSNTYRIAMDGNNNKIFLVPYTIPKDTERFLEGDEVCVYGKYAGVETYSSTVSMSVTVPRCDADLIIRPIKNNDVKRADAAELEQTLSDIRERLKKVVKAEDGYNKLTKSNYGDYARNAKLHNDEKITFSGKALQVIEGSGRYNVRLSVDSDSDKVIYLTVAAGVTDIRILEDDTLTIRGKYTGLYTYSSTRGGDITIPSCAVESLSIKGYKTPNNFPKDNDGNFKLSKTQFEDYSRRPSAHENENITFSAKVLQVIEGKNSSEYRMAVDNDSNYVIYVTISNDDRSMRILEDDKVTVVAKFTGLLTYESTMGVSITIPQCRATSIVVPGKTAQTAQQSADGSYKVTKSNYEAFARDEKTYMDKTISFKAEVAQVVDDDDYVIYRLAVDKNYDCMFLAIIENKDLSIRILEDDVITVKATSRGLYSYQSTMGGTITIPSCIITEYEVEGYKKAEIKDKDNEGNFRITKNNYDELARNPDPYFGKKITFKAKVIQVVERSGGANVYRVAVDSDNNRVFYVEYDLPSGASRILENDVITLKGTYYGIFSYETTMGNMASVPATIADYMGK